MPTQILAPQPAWLDIETFPPVEAEAQRIAARLLQAEPSPLGPPSAARPTTAEQPDFHALDVNSPHMTRPRSVGLEHVSLWAAQQLGLPQLPQQLGRSGPQRNAAPGLLIARMAAPASERATWIWLRERSAAGGLLGCDFETVRLSALYRAGDRLLQHRKALESKLFARCAGLFDPAPTVTLVDLTNTFFEGSAQRQPLARRGRSQEKRSDCPLLSLVLNSHLIGDGWCRLFGHGGEGVVPHWADKCAVRGVLGGASVHPAPPWRGALLLQNQATARKKEGGCCRRRSRAAQGAPVPVSPSGGVAD